jgi:hypothetical protein
MHIWLAGRSHGPGTAPGSLSPSPGLPATGLHGTRPGPGLRPGPGQPWARVQAPRAVPGPCERPVSYICIHILQLFYVMFMLILHHFKLSYIVSTLVLLYSMLFILYHITLHYLIKQVPKQVPIKIHLTKRRRRQLRGVWDPRNSCPG